MKNVLADLALESTLGDPMKAVPCNGFQGPVGLAGGEAPSPALGGDEVRIAVHCASVTFMDNLPVSGLYQIKPPLPFVPGTDAAGEVMEVGDKVTRFKSGDRGASPKLSARLCCRSEPCTIPFLSLFLNLWYRRF